MKIDIKKSTPKKVSILNMVHTMKTFGFVVAIAALALAGTACGEEKPAKTSQAQSSVSSAPAPSPAGPLEVQPTDIVMGSPVAPVFMVEYVSMTCPHCAHFHNDVLPPIKEQFIDTGKVKLATRELPFDQWAFAVSKISRCAASSGNYHSFVSAFFQTQEAWRTSPNPLDAIKKVARLGGMLPEKVDECIENNAKVHETILEINKVAREQVNVTGTPSIFLNGTRYTGPLDSDALAGAIRQALQESK